MCKVVEQQRYRNPEPFDVGSCRLRQASSPEPDHVEIGAWSRDRGRGEPVISVLQQLQQRVRRAVSARAARWLTHVSCRPGARGVTLRRAGLLEDSATSSFLVRVSTAVSAESSPSTWPAIVSA